MDVQGKVLEVVKKHGKAMALEMVDEIVFAALDEVVKDSSNPFDDMMLNVLREPLKKALVDLIAKI